MATTCYSITSLTTICQDGDHSATDQAPFAPRVYAPWPNDQDMNGKSIYHSTVTGPDATMLMSYTFPPAKAWPSEYASKIYVFDINGNPTGRGQTPVERGWCQGIRGGTCMFLVDTLRYDFFQDSTKRAKIYWGTASQGFSYKPDQKLQFPFCFCNRGSMEKCLVASNWFCNCPSGNDNGRNKYYQFFQARGGTISTLRNRDSKCDTASPTKSTPTVSLMPTWSPLAPTTPSPIIPGPDWIDDDNFRCYYRHFIRDDKRFNRSIKTEEAVGKHWLTNKWGRFKSIPWRARNYVPPSPDRWGNKLDPTDLGYFGCSVPENNEGNFRLFESCQASTQCPRGWTCAKGWCWRCRTRGDWGCQRTKYCVWNETDARCAECWSDADCELDHWKGLSNLEWESPKCSDTEQICIDCRMFDMWRHECVEHGCEFVKHKYDSLDKCRRRQIGDEDSDKVPRWVWVLVGGAAIVIIFAIYYWYKACQKNEGRTIGYSKISPRYRREVDGDHYDTTQSDSDITSVSVTEDPRDWSTISDSPPFRDSSASSAYSFVNERERELDRLRKAKEKAKKSRRSRRGFHYQ